MDCVNPEEITIPEIGTGEIEEHTSNHRSTPGMGGYVWRNKETDPHLRKRFLCTDQQVSGFDAVAFAGEEQKWQPYSQELRTKTCIQRKTCSGQ